MHAQPVPELGLLLPEQRETREEQRAIERGDALVGFDGQRGGEDEGAVGAGFDVGRPLRLLLGGQQHTRGRRPLEVQPLARRNHVRAGEGHHELRRTLAFGQRLPGGEARQYPHSVLNGGSAISRE